MPAGVTTYNVFIGKLGQDDAHGKRVTEGANMLIPLLQGHVDSGAITPVEYEVYKGTGWDALAEAMTAFVEGKLKNKTVVRLQD